MNVIVWLDFMIGLSGLPLYCYSVDFGPAEPQIQLHCPVPAHIPANVQFIQFQTPRRNPSTLTGRAIL